MQIFRGIEAVRSFIENQKKENKTIGLVPTMGALHEGHLSLVKQAMAQTDICIATIFVNPLQFNNTNDLEKYPRTFDADSDLLQSINCRAVFVPMAIEMYPQPAALSFDFGNLDKILEGKFRPGHFSGVGIVVSKLLNIIQPHIAYFGQKDYQQFLVIQQLVKDLSIPCNLVCGEIVRDANGLALSSRNQRLSTVEREKATLLFQALSIAKAQIQHKSLNVIKVEIDDLFKKSNLRLEYFELATQSDLQIMDEYDSNTPSIFLIAAYVGEVRLIDNIYV